jgi:hypothetical protein
VGSPPKKLTVMVGLGPQVASLSNAALRPRTAAWLDADKAGGVGHMQKLNFVSAILSTPLVQNGRLGDSLERKQPRNSNIRLRRQIAIQN